MTAVAIPPNDTGSQPPLPPARAADPPAKETEAPKCKCHYTFALDNMTLTILFITHLVFSRKVVRLCADEFELSVFLALSTSYIAGFIFAIIFPTIGAYVGRDGRPCVDQTSFFLGAVMCLIISYSRS
ncbi:hypothetical protein TWF481_004099 [Arthrobotrys musiformis]|uniref:Major facilitator superfamily (MFS) profile domain-containing protein n=1 Tax=Arthrobotrys musiformis TaxID=47236 RepID=A0AAV9WK25_9PEZI